MADERESRRIRAQLRVAAGLWSGAQKESIPADRFLSRYFFHHRKKTGARDRRFLSETIFSAFRHKSFLEAWLESGRGFAQPSPEGAERDVLFCSLAAAKEHLIGKEFFDGTGLLEGVYEALQDQILPEGCAGLPEDEKHALLYSFPLWLVKRWRERYGAEKAEKLCSCFLSRPRPILRTNTLKTTREKLIGALCRMGVKAEAAPRSPFGVILRERRNVLDSPAFRDGWFELQDEGSQLVCLKMDAKPGETVWDVCAGGGGKSLMLAAMMENKGRIVATDLRGYKLDELKKRAKRAGAFNIFPVNLDRMSELAVARKGFDRILVDAPCSGTGTMGRNPDAKWRIDETWFARLHEEQAGILEKALPYLKKNGKLYYATCSLEPVENETLVEEVLAKHPELRCVPCGDAGERFFALWPPESGTDGFFLATMEKT
jgi:16S rRNA (cytosine967-C5)-methyltransferase